MENSANTFTGMIDWNSRATTPSGSVLRRIVSSDKAYVLPISPGDADQAIQVIEK